MQDRIEKIKDYFISFNIAEGVAYIQIKLPNKWDAPSSEVLEENFQTKTAKESNGTIYFFSEMDNGIMNVFDAVDFTVEYNKDLEEKSELFRVKIEELKNLFATKSLDELKTLNITFSEPTILPWKENGSKSVGKRGKTQVNKKEKGIQKHDNDNVKEDVNNNVGNELVENDKSNVDVIVDTQNDDTPTSIETSNSLLEFAQSIID